VRLAAGIPADDPVTRQDNIPLALLGWFTGSILIWAALFALGNFLYGRMGYAIVLTVIAAVTGTVLVKVVQQLWSATDEVSAERAAGIAGSQ
jgi:hypothetical protein